MQITPKVISPIADAPNEEVAIRKIKFFGDKYKPNEKPASDKNKSCLKRVYKIARAFLSFAFIL